MQRTFGFDVLACARCGGRLRLIALIDEAAVIDRIRGDRGWRTEVPEQRRGTVPASDIENVRGERRRAGATRERAFDSGPLSTIAAVARGL